MTAWARRSITYPRAEVRYLPESLIADVPRIVAGLRVGLVSAIPVPEPPVIRKGASGSFNDKGLEGAGHHAVIPNVNTVDDLRQKSGPVFRPARKNCLTSLCGHISPL